MTQRDLELATLLALFKRLRADIRTVYPILKSVPTIREIEVVDVEEKMLRWAEKTADEIRTGLVKTPTKQQARERLKRAGLAPPTKEGE